MPEEHKDWCRLLDIGGWCDCKGQRGPTSANNPYMPNPRGPNG